MNSHIGKIKKTLLQYRNGKLQTNINCIRKVKIFCVYPYNESNEFKFRETKEHTRPQGTICKYLIYLINLYTKVPMRAIFLTRVSAFYQKMYHIATFIWSPVVGSINPFNAETILSKAQELKNLWKLSKPYHLGIHWKALIAFSQMSTHLPRFRSFFSFFHIILYWSN